MNRKIDGMLGLARRSGNLAYGFDQVREEVFQGKVLLVVLATDSSDRTMRNMQEICQENQTPWIVYGTKYSLSQAIGLVNKAVLGIREPNMARQIAVYYKETESKG